MYNTRIVKFKLKRGTNSQRVQITPRSGELIFTNDLKRCFIGDGSTVGGLPISNITSISTTFPTFTALGDFVYRPDLLRTYVCTTSGFTFTGPYPDTTTIEISANYLQVVSASITKDKLYTYIASLTGGMNFDNTNGLSISHDNTLVITDNKLSAYGLGGSITIDSTTQLSAGSIHLNNAVLKSYVGTLTADGTFLILKINGVRQGIRLWQPSLNDVVPPGPPPPPADTEFILANDLSPIISNDGDNIVWTTASRRYLITEDGEYIMTEDTDDILWDI